MVFHFIIITANLKRNTEIGVLAQTEGLSIQDLDHFSQDQHMQFWDPDGKGTLDAQIRPRESEMNTH